MVNKSHVRLPRFAITAIIISVLAIILSLLSIVAAHASTLTGTQFACTYTDPEYQLADDSASLTPYGGTAFSASEQPGGPVWQDAYLVTGWSHDLQTYDLCGHYGADYAYRLPFTMSDPVSIYGSLYYDGCTVKCRAGWDIWLVPTGDQSSELSATAFERNPNAVEIMVQPGKAGLMSWGRAPWYRAYINAGDLHCVNLTSMIDTAMARMGRNPADYQLMAVDAGAEFYANGITVTGYSLSVTTTATERDTYTATESYTARNGDVTSTATERATVTSTRSVTLPLQGSNYAGTRELADNEAMNAAYSTAHNQAIAYAESKAHTMAVGEQKVKLAEIAANAAKAKVTPLPESQVRLPNVVHDKLGTAITVLKDAGFRPVAPRGVRASGLVTWEAGHPGAIYKRGQAITIHATDKR